MKIKKLKEEIISDDGGDDDENARVDDSETG